MNKYLIAFGVLLVAVVLTPVAAQSTDGGVYAGQQYQNFLQTFMDSANSWGGPLRRLADTH